MTYIKMTVQSFTINHLTTASNEQTFSNNSEVNSSEIIKEMFPWYYYIQGYKFSITQCFVNVCKSLIDPYFVGNTIEIWVCLSSRFSRNSEAYAASEFIENLEEMLFITVHNSHSLMSVV